MMERKRKMVQYDEIGEIKKGPWKVEEDEVLINHVKKCGPRDWSSIRSKGLLQRTGKSCRLRWVNKLRPDLKTGVKFSAEEERTVIELQAQFGNKWAKIATHLPGRTDNDVKNFWSSRQKRLARILHTSTPLFSSKPLKNTTKQLQTPTPFPSPPSPQAPNLSTSTEKKLAPHSQLCPYRNIVHPTSLVYQHSAFPHEYIPPEKKPLAPPHLSFPLFPLLQPDYPFLMESQDFLGRQGDSSFLYEFEHSCGHALGTAQIPIVPSFLGPERRSQVSGPAESHDTVDIDSLIDDFPPMEIFDQIEPLPSPSEWS